MNSMRSSSSPPAISISCPSWWSARRSGSLPRRPWNASPSSWPRGAVSARRRARCGGHELAGQHGAIIGSRRSGTAHGLRREARVVLDSSRDHRGSEGHRACGMSQHAQRVVGDVLEDHHPGAARRPARQERRQAGEVRLDEVGQASGRELGHVVHRGAQLVEGQCRVGGGELAVVEHRASGDVDQRVLGRCIDLDLEHPFQRLGAVQRGAVDLTERPEPERVLDAPAGARIALVPEQPAHGPGRAHRTGVRATRVDLFGERLRGAAHRTVRECGDEVRRVEQPAKFLPDEHGPREGDCVGGHEREGVAGLEADRVDVPGGPRQMTGQRERDLGQRREVAGADGAGVVHGGHRIGLQCLLERVQETGMDTAAGGRELVESNHHRRPHRDLVQRFPDPRGVAEQQAQVVVTGCAADHHRVAVGADPGGAAVDRPDPAQFVRNLVRADDLPFGVRSQRHRRRPTGGADHVLAAQRPAVDGQDVSAGHDGAPSAAGTGSGNRVGRRWTSYRTPPRTTSRTSGTPGR